MDVYPLSYVYMATLPVGREQELCKDNTYLSALAGIGKPPL